MPEIVLAVDQGTTGTRALLVSGRGKLIGQAYTEFTQHFPKPGWVEHNPEEIWSSTQKVIHQALEHSRTSPQHIAAIGITNQRETTILWDRRNGKPVGRAIVWQCRRSSVICDTLKKKGFEPLFRKKTGLVLDAYFSGTKIRWALDHWPRVRQLAKAGHLCFGTVDSWLIWKLSGQKAHLTDVTNASRTLLYNIHQKKWDPALCKALKIPQTILPEVVPSAGILAKTAQHRWLPKGIPISGVAGDQQASLFGHGCHKAGQMKNTYGTGSFIVLNLGKQTIREPKGLITTLGCDAKGKPIYCLEGSVFIGGAVIQWLRDSLKIIQDAKETEQIAKSLPDSAGVYLVPAFTGLGAPHWDMETRGAVLGLTRGATRSHLIRAALESIAYQVEDCVEVMKQYSKVKMSTLKVDGGATANNFLMQFQADISNLQIERTRSAQVTALGAAALAGIGAGIWKDSSAIQRLTQPDKRFKPKLPRKQRHALCIGWKNALNQVKRERTHQE